MMTQILFGFLVLGALFLGGCDKGSGDEVAQLALVADKTMKVVIESRMDATPKPKAEEENTNEQERKSQETNEEPPGENIEPPEENVESPGKDTESPGKDTESPGKDTESPGDETPKSEETPKTGDEGGDASVGSGEVTGEATGSEDPKKKTEDETPGESGSVAPVEPVKAPPPKQEAENIDQVLRTELAAAQVKIVGVKKDGLSDLKKMVATLQSYRDIVHKLLAANLKRYDFVAESVSTVLGKTVATAKKALKDNLDPTKYKEIGEDHLNTLATALDEFARTNRWFRHYLKKVDVAVPGADPDPLASARENVGDAFVRLQNMAVWLDGFKLKAKLVHDNIGYSPTEGFSTTKPMFIEIVAPDLQDLFVFETKLEMMKNVMFSRVFNVLALSRPFFESVVEILSNEMDLTDVVDSITTSVIAMAQEKALRETGEPLGAGDVWLMKVALPYALKKELSAFCETSRKFLERLDAGGDGVTQAELEAVFQSIEEILEFDKTLAKKLKKYD